MRQVPNGTGYADPAYAETLAGHGAPRRLTHSRGSILVRSVPGTDAYDAIGPYPLFACADWDGLAEDVDALRGELATLTLVADPFGAWTPEQLAGTFVDVCVPFKEHFVVDLTRPPLESASRHHRRDTARSRRLARVERVSRPPQFAAEWEELYRGLVARQGIRGIAAFPGAALERQLHLNGMVAFRAECDGALAGGALWLVAGSVAYYHLAAYNERGYARGRLLRAHGGCP